MIKLKKVSKNIKVKGEKQVILHNINLEIEKGEFVSIMGPVGSGKSTLLSIMGLMHTGYNGEYYLDGQNMNDIKSREMSEIRNKKIGFIGQEAHLLGKFNILENIELPLLHKGHSAFKRNELILSFLKDTSLDKSILFIFIKQSNSTPIRLRKFLLSLNSNLKTLSSSISLGYKTIDLLFFFLWPI